MQKEKHCHRNQVPEVQLQAVKQVVSWMPVATFGNPSEEHVHVHIPPLCPPSASYEINHSNTDNIINNFQTEENVFINSQDPEVTHVIKF